MIPVIVISLIRVSDRRLSIQKSLDALHIPFHFFDAVDGRTMSAAEVAAFAPQPYKGQYGRELSPGEIGCAASYWSILQKIERERSEFVCVAEDDADFSVEFLQFLNEDQLRSLPEFDVLRLHNDHRNGTSGFATSVASLGGFSIFAPLKPRLFATAQIFTADGATKILKEMIPLRGPIDNVIYRDARIACLRVLEVRPAVVTIRQTTSTIGTRLKTARTAKSILARKAFIVARNVRSILNFSRAWGFWSLFHLRYHP